MDGEAHVYRAFWIDQVFDQSDLEIIDPGQSTLELMSGVYKEVQVFCLCGWQVQSAPQ